MANRIQLRRGGAQEWANANPTLAQGELGIELDTNRFKIGDGVSAWNTLGYARPIESVTNTANTLVVRDADGNFSAGTITATLTGNASTASRLASTRQIALTGDIESAGLFDGNQNLTLPTSFPLQQSLPHHDGTDTSFGDYTQVRVDAKGRVINAFSPTTIQAYGLDTGIQGTGAQPYSSDLNSIASLNTNGILTRTSTGNVTTREVRVTSTQRLVVNNGNGINGDPTLDLALTTVVPDPNTYDDGDYNTESLTSVTATGTNGEPVGTETVNTVKFTVDKYGRLQSATNVPIATATEGSKYASYDAGTAYVRYDIIENA